jgi:hypothetical protein
MAEPGLRRSPAKRVSRETGIEGSNPSLSAKICKANFGGESKIEIRDLILQDFRFGKFRLSIFKTMTFIHILYGWVVAPGSSGDIRQEAKNMAEQSRIDNRDLM